jgi:hypothetical protein
MARRRGCGFVACLDILQSGSGWRGRMQLDRARSSRCSAVRRFGRRAQQPGGMRRVGIPMSQWACQCGCRSRAWLSEVQLPWPRYGSSLCVQRTSCFYVWPSVPLRLVEAEHAMLPGCAAPFIVSLSLNSPVDRPSAAAISSSLLLIFSFQCVGDT